eukprot:jgi/Mesvir1/19667/Mv09943-RA.1
MAGAKDIPAITLFVLVAVASVAHASFVVERHSLRLTGGDLSGEYEASIGNIGVPLYGGSLRGMLVYPETNKDGCTSFAPRQFAPPRAGDLARIVLVDRGACYFTQKIFAVQQAGASAVIVADNVDEPLITMDSPADDDVDYGSNITIPSALVQKTVGDMIKAALTKGTMVLAELDWTEALPHPDDRVEWELWMNSNQGCGPKCDTIVSFIDSFNPVGQDLEKKGATQFSPHYMTWYCPREFVESMPCDKQCIYMGRYCAPDPEKDFEVGYDGRDVVAENLRQLCVFKQANDTKRPWLWWSYVSDFNQRCRMVDQNFNKACAEKVVQAIGLDVGLVNTCMGDTTRDVDHPLLLAEQRLQVGNGKRGDVSILPTVVINLAQYRGKLEKLSVLKAICSGFDETTEPSVCLSGDIQTDDCAVNNGGCWKDGDYTACVDTFRGKKCICPTVGDVMFLGDGYEHCEASGSGRCHINNGGCWSMTRGNKTYSACQANLRVGCQCPDGFYGDPYNECKDMNECEMGRCVCQHCICTNKFGSFTCGCSKGYVFDPISETCAALDGNGSLGAGAVFFIVLAIAIVASAGGYMVYRYWMRRPYTSHHMTGSD